MHEPINDMTAILRSFGESVISSIYPLYAGAIAHIKGISLHVIMIIYHDG